MGTVQGGQTDKETGIDESGQLYGTNQTFGQLATVAPVL